MLFAECENCFPPRRQNVFSLLKVLSSVSPISEKPDTNRNNFFKCENYCNIMIMVVSYCLI